MTIIFDEDKQGRKISDLHKSQEEELVQEIAAKYGLGYIDLTISSINSDALRLIDEQTATTSKVAAYAIVNKKVKVAVRFPDSPQVAEVLNTLKEKKFEPEVHIASTASLEKAWKAYKDLSFATETKAGSLDIASEEIAAIANDVKGLPTVQSILENTLSMKKSYRVSRILETILAGALATGASDVHIEPEEEYIRLRYRLDGVLTNVINFDFDTFNLLLSRIKLLSGLKLNIKKDSQDGRFTIKLAESDIEIRTSVLPGSYNESIVLRILNPKAISTPLEELGMPKKLLSILMEEVEKPNGMILTTGPTGSGKTTTLYAFLKKVKNPGVKIITIEDPIEYHLEGITQTQVNDKGYTFLDGLRAALRQDPDVIMVGEIRDGETAAIAINSALTGHLVFSTLHTNDAAGAFPRLIDLGINPKVISSAVSVALAQRLVRRLCPTCKKEVPIEGDAKTTIDAIVASVVDKTELPQNTTKMWVSVGCDKCNGVGYKGRVGIYEGILVNQSMEKVLEYGSSDREIATAAAPQAILNMKQDGIIKILQGVTSLEELTRVIEVIV